MTNRFLPYIKLNWTNGLGAAFAGAVVGWATESGSKKDRPAGDFHWPSFSYAIGGAGSATVGLITRNPTWMLIGLGAMSAALVSGALWMNSRTGRYSTALGQPIFGD